MWRVPRAMQQKYTVLMWCNYWIKCLYTVCLLLNRYSTSRRRTLQVFFKRIDLVVYITQQFVLVKPINSKKGAGGSTFVVHPPRVRWYVLYFGVKLQINFSFDQILSVLFSNLLKNFVIFYRSLHIIESTPITVNTFIHTVFSGRFHEDIWLSCSRPSVKGRK